MIINVQTLAEVQACPNQVQLFEQFLAQLGQNSVECTEEMAQKAAQYGLDVCWAIKNLKLPFTGSFQDQGGIKYWYRNGLLHREDGPAMEWPDGAREWYRNGQLHREDGPAVEQADGATKEWYRNNQRHREDGPAVEWVDGAKYWYRNGQLHREDGPAMEYSDGTKVWYRNGQFLQDNGRDPNGPS